MSSNSGLSAPGTSSYSSGTMFVGDGTWDSQRNTFLLPNLVGLNFETMRYNGMGNRFRDLPQYHRIILGHAILGAITFLGIVPAAILTARFYHRNPALALRLHIWLQILTVGLTTVVFILGNFAVGPARALTNPHHGIGLTIYILILFQALWGWIVHAREKGKARSRIPRKLLFHQWLGRAIALLGIIQVPLGLTLYGSPKTLFILYTLFMTALLILYFTLSYRNQTPLSIDDGNIYSTGSRVDASESRHSHRHGLGRLAALGTAGAGIAALARRNRNRNRSRSRSRSQSRHRTHETSVVEGGRAGPRIGNHSRHPSGSVVDEKYAVEGRSRPHTWRDRFLGTAAGVGTLALVRNVMGRRRQTGPSYSSGSTYSGPLSGSDSVAHDDVSRVEEGRAPASPETGRQGRLRGQATSVTMAAPPAYPDREELSSYTGTSESYSRSGVHRDYGVRDGVAALGLAGFLRHKIMSRRNVTEDRRVEAIRKTELENERVNRANSRRYTGDGHLPRRSSRTDTVSDLSPIIGSNPELSLHGVPPIPTNAGSSGRRRADLQSPAVPGSLPRTSRLSPGGTRAVGLGAATAAAAAGMAVGHGTHHHESSHPGDSVTSAPLSVKLNVHKDGRHVTLRRLNEAEAAAERQAKRQERGAGRRKRAGSLSSVDDSAGIGYSGDGSETANEHYRRVEAVEAAQAKTKAQLDPVTKNSLPPPPPMPGASALDQSVSSPGTAGAKYDNATDVSAPEINRRRRRAERSQAKQARAGTGRVEFE